MYAHAYVHKVNMKAGGEAYDDEDDDGYLSL